MHTPNGGHFELAKLLGVMCRIRAQLEACSEVYPQLSTAVLPLTFMRRQLRVYRTSHKSETGTSGDVQLNHTEGNCGFPSVFTVSIAAGILVCLRELFRSCSHCSLVVMLCLFGLEHPGLSILIASLWHWGPPATNALRPKLHSKASQDA